MTCRMVALHSSLKLANAIWRCEVWCCGLEKNLIPDVDVELLCEVDGNECGNQVPYPRRDMRLVARVQQQKFKRRRAQAEQNTEPVAVGQKPYQQATEYAGQDNSACVTRPPDRDRTKN